ncbi:MAG: hypothetical protein QOE89_696 [Pseudonocardiales bacterium]|nr:hypothetical protein [Pseudonocardiales bacterium]
MSATTTSTAKGTPQTRRAGQAAADGQLTATATATVTGGVLLTMLPMRSVFTDWGWLVASVGCVLPYVAIQVAFRLQRAPRWWQVLLGLLASALALAWVFIPDHLFLGILPTTASLDDVRRLLQSAHETMQAEHAPVRSTPALRLLTAGATVLLVALTDVLAILLRRPLLAAAPLLEVLAVASATSSKAASPILFAAAAIGFLLILLAGTRLQDRRWGPSVDGSAGRLGGARRMAVTGIVAALVVPIILPSVSTNLLARATHHNGTGSGSSSSQRVVLNTSADLSGSLRRGSPVDLVRVQVAPTDKPFYIRQVVLDQFRQSGWLQSPSQNNRQSPMSDGSFPLEPASTLGETGNGQSSVINATFTILRLGGDTLPILANPADIQASVGGTWDSSTATISSGPLQSGMTYIETADQPAPTEDELRSAPAFTTSTDPSLDGRYLSLPALPTTISDLAKTITLGKTNAYDRARAISDYFINRKNGFVYSLDTAPSDGRSALETFLDKKQGFCQQYAAAAAVLMREAGLPSRVVLGYTHRAPDNSGNFVVTTADAHAWVEVYFSGIGWVAFDPTPLGGADAGRAVALPWAPHSTAPAGTGSAGPSVGASRPNDALQPTGRAAGPQAGVSPSTGVMPWRVAAALLAVLLLIALLITGPQLLRVRLRRRRLHRARSTGSTEPLWQELTASATDREALWPQTITVGQVPSWLAGHGVDERGRAVLSTIASAVERERFSAHGQAEVSPDAIAGLDQAMRRWARRAERRQRILRWWLPRSLFSRGDASRR